MYKYDIIVATMIIFMHVTQIVIQNFNLAWLESIISRKKYFLLQIMALYKATTTSLIFLNVINPYSVILSYPKYNVATIIKSPNPYY